MEYNFNRFLTEHDKDYATALSEVKSAKTTSRWMWYIFPQINGLGQSETSKIYAIHNLKEAREYVKHPVLGTHLIEISEALLDLETNDAYSIFGKPYDKKLHSCMTLFDQVSGNTVFEKVLCKYFDGKFDQKTLELIASNEE